MKSKLILAAFITGSVFVSSCNPKDDDDKNQNVNYQTLSSDSQLAQSLSDDASTQVNNETKGGVHSDDIQKTTNGNVVSWTSQMDTCAEITLVTNGGVFPMTLTIDFGTGCLGLDGRTRKGKIMAEYSGLYTTPGTVVTVTFDNYYVSDYAGTLYKVEGVKTITNNGRNSSNQLSFTEQDANGRITKPNGDVITWESTRTNTWVNGETSTGWFGIFDDKYNVTGSASGEASDGTEYEINITTPLHYEVLCGTNTYNVVTAGGLSYEVEGTEVATVDYGTGSCDRNGSVTYGGQTYSFVIQ